MRNFVADFPQHIANGIQIGDAFKAESNVVKINNVCILGLGGSGIGGTIAADITRETSKVPIVSSKGYVLPNFVDQHTLVIASSYSGNTEETLEMLAQAKKKNAHIVGITSGGILEENATQEGFNVIKIPGGFPPRAAFGFSMIQLLFVLSAYGVIDAQVLQELNQVPSFLNQHTSQIQEDSLTIAQKLFGKIPVIYSDEVFSGVAVRFRQQINENSKMLCWHHVVPEMNHNELVGWAGAPDQMAVVLLRSLLEHKRNTKRIEINKDIIAKRCNSIFEIWAKGNTYLEHVFYLIHFTDWVSVHLAELKKIDAIEVDVITHLKTELQKF